MSTVLKQISELVTNEDITITALEKIIGASKGVLSRALSNGSDIQTKWVQRIVENYPRYNVEWLLTGKGAMLKETLSNENISDAFIGLLRQQIDYFKEENEGLKEENKKLIEANGYYRGLLEHNSISYKQTS